MLTRSQAKSRFHYSDIAAAGFMSRGDALCKYGSVLAQANWGGEGRSILGAPDVRSRVKYRSLSIKYILYASESILLSWLSGWERWVITASPPPISLVDSYNKQYRGAFWLKVLENRRKRPGTFFASLALLVDSLAIHACVHQED